MISDRVARFVPLADEFCSGSIVDSHAGDEQCGPHARLVQTRQDSAIDFASGHPGQLVRLGVVHGDDNLDRIAVISRAEGQAGNSCETT